MIPNTIRKNINKDYRSIGQNLSRLLGHKESKIPFFIIINLLELKELESRLDTIINYLTFKEPYIMGGK